MNGKSWPYLAAMYDGEGSICIGKSSTRGRTEYSLHTPVFNTSYPVMKWLQHHFGGNVKPMTKTALTRKLSYRWGNYGHAAQAEILTNTLPMFVIKKEQAETALEYLQLHGNRHAQAEREKLYLRLKELNATETTYGFPEKYKEADEYVAGILDGEGSICISRPIGYAPRLEVRISTSSPNLVRWVHGIYGGRYTFRSARANRDEYCWYPSGKKNKETLLLQLIPHMIAKREQAVLALEYLRTGDSSLADKVTSLNDGNSPTTNTQEADCPSR